MIPINGEVAIKQEILEISLSSPTGSHPRVNNGSSGKKKKRAGPEEKKTAAATKKAPRTAPKPKPKPKPRPGASSPQPGVLSTKLTIAQKDALRLAFTGHTSVPSLASRNAWASANNVKGEAVHRYCRYLRDRSNYSLIKQEPGTVPRMDLEAEWELSVEIPTSAEKMFIQGGQGEVRAPILQTGVSKSYQPDFPVPVHLSPSTAVLPHAPGPSSDTTTTTSHPPTLQFSLESVQMPDCSFLSNTRFFDLLTGPEAIVYGDLHDPITFCMKFQDSYCSLDMEVAHEALRTMYFFERWDR